MAKRIAALLAAVGLLGVVAIPATARNANANNSYTVHNLVSDGSVPGTATDPDLVNAWGISASATSPWWVADNETDKSTLYNGAGVKIPRIVSVDGGPTGTVFNGTSDFVVASGTGSGPALFLFATEAGTIRGWNPNVPAAGSNDTEVGATSTDAIYKGLAIGSVGTANYLYAADFHHARVDVFDGSFHLQSWAGAFVDPGIPAGFAPFGIQNLNGQIFVAYAKQDADQEDEIAGAGLGYVSAFGTDGAFLGRVASGGALNAPWGLALAPTAAPGFGRFSGNLLVGNFGDGRINAFARASSGWEARGHLKDANHRPIAIDGLWGIGFGNGANSGPVTTLYFAAGPDDETHGLFGSITTP
jgi:uncharacterized protein (TIGR03118 family)